MIRAGWRGVKEWSERPQATKFQQQEPRSGLFQTFNQDRVSSQYGCSSVRSFHKLDVNRMWNNPAFMSFDEQALNCFAPALAVIKREVVHPHRDETIR